MTIEVRHNLDTYRYVTVCDCERTVSMPDSGLATHVCECGRVWKSNGAEVSMWTPSVWNEQEGHDS